jgi:hypothetical protein
MSSGLTDKQKRRLETLLAEEDKLIREMGDVKPLRFNRRGLSASVIGEQFYCEKKAEMRHLYGEIETETKVQGIEAHESLLSEAEATTRSQLLEEILSGEPVIAHEMPLIALHGDVLLAGQPDAVLFRDGDPLIVIEAKFSGSKLPYPSYHAQARTYCLMLDSLGFDTSYLFYAIAVMPRGGERDERLSARLVDVIRENGLQEATLSVGGGHVYMYEFDIAEARRDVDWALGYWRGQREAQAADNPNKCRSCEYRDKCVAI